MARDLDAVRPLLVWSERSTLEIKTGGWRTHRPQYVERTAPCRNACPAVEDIARWIEQVREGNYRQAWDLLREENPFPAVMGRVCAHPCESACNRGSFDGAVAINALERFVGDWGLRHGDPGQPLGRREERVAVVGGGPAGLACAYYLARIGYSVTIYEAKPALGGLLRYGIPEYRLPRSVLDREIELVLALGIRVHTGAALGEGLRWEGLGEYRALFLATGASLPYHLNVLGEHAGGVRDGVAFLHDVNSGGRPEVGSRVVVVGGGSTAMDVARTARRLGVPSVTVLALESWEEMPAIPEEVAQARAEGIQIRNNVGIAEVRERGGVVVGVRAQSARLERTSSGGIHPVLFPGTEFDLETDGVLLAIGQTPDLKPLPTGLLAEQGMVAVDALGATHLPRVFAGGDLTPGQHSVADAVGSGKRGAIAIDRYLREGSPSSFPAPLHLGTSSSLSMGVYLGRDGLEPNVRAQPQEVTPFSVINLDYFPGAGRAERNERHAAERIGSFEEVVEGLGETRARAESLRCFTCGGCTHCDNCLIFCPDMAILRADGGYSVVRDYCKGCGLCVHECPRGALVMVPERS